MASEVADAAPAVDPEQLRARADAYGLSDERRAELAAMMAAIPWADPELAVERWLGCEADGLHDTEALDRYRREHPEEYQHPATVAAERKYRMGIVLWTKEQVRRPPRSERPVARARERRSPRRSVRRASCRARSPGRKQSDPEPALAHRRGERR